MLFRPHKQGIQWRIASVTFVSACVQASNRRTLAVAGATGSKVMKLNIAMQYLTENSRFAGDPLSSSLHPVQHALLLLCSQIVHTVYSMTE